MFELPKTTDVCKLIALTKSNSGVSGPDLARAHMQLGHLLAEAVPFPPEDTTVVAILRGGILLAEGMYFRLNCQFETYDPKRQEFIRPKTKYVILVDSVINTGKTLLPLLEQNTLVACGVINRKALPLFDKHLLAARISDNSYIGSNIATQTGNKGPDTTMRLFNQL